MDVARWGLSKKVRKQTLLSQNTWWWWCVVLLCCCCCVVVLDAGIQQDVYVENTGALIVQMCAESPGSKNFRRLHPPNPRQLTAVSHRGPPKYQHPESWRYIVEKTATAELQKVFSTVSTTPCRCTPRACQQLCPQMNHLRQSPQR